MRPVYFLSDFGLEDPYVAVVQAVLAGSPGSMMQRTAFRAWQPHRVPT